jgi:L-threonylcarbamoyladenylate synthase
MAHPLPRSPAILAPTDEAIAAAAAAIRDGRLVAFPTETVYGLGGDATNDRAVAAIFALKGRPSFNPLIVHVPDLDAARLLVAVDARAERLAARFWPGPLTLVLKRREGCPVSLLASAGLDSLAVRAPAHPVAQALLKAAGRPLAAPSANPSGKVSPTTAQHVVDGFAAGAAADTEADSLVMSSLAMVLDGGSCAIGLESTVVDLSGDAPVLLRHGGVTEEELTALLGPLAAATIDDGLAPRAPGQLLSHYAPDRPLRLEATAVAPDEALLAFGPKPLSGAAVAANLSPTGDLTEAAANLFALLRRLDRPEVSRIAVMKVPERGLGRAINDRLRRAAAPR